MNLFTYQRGVLWVVLFVVLLPLFTHAIPPPDSALGQINSERPEEAGRLRGVDTYRLVGSIVNLVNWFAWFIAVVAVAMGLYSGFMFISSQGEPTQLATARKTLLWAVVGIVVALIAFSIIVITKTTLNL